MQAPMIEASKGRLEVGSAEHFRWLHSIVAAVLVLNLLDAVFTLFWVRAGLATEANPLVADLVNHHAVLFVVVKTCLVGLGSVLLWWRRQRPIAVVGIFAAFITYYGVLLYHLQYASGLVGLVLSRG